MIKFEVLRPGMFSTIQDIGRFGFQATGVPVAGAMDAQSLKIGNILVGNDENAAAIEMTVIGATMRVLEGRGILAVTGANLGFKINGSQCSNWTTYEVTEGDEISFTAPSGDGCRALLCVNGGFDVPLVMGSRSTYTRGKLGGFCGRALKAGDVLTTGTSNVSIRAGAVCPAHLRPVRDINAPIRIIPGLQESAFTQKGIETFYESTYKITSSADRMGYRMEGAVIEHVSGADIISDAICLGSVQVPGHGQPIVMLADRQTTGGYTKLGTVCTVDIANLAQRLPGQDVKFARITRDEAVKLLRAEAEQLDRLKQKKSMILTVDGTKYNVSWEEI